MVGLPFCTLSGRLRLTLTVLMLIIFTALAGSTRSAAASGVRDAALPVTATASIVHSLNPGTEGNQPIKGLVQGPDGSLYGITTNGFEGVFKVTPGGAFTVLHRFGTFADGDIPNASLLLVGNMLFGVCYDAGGYDIQTRAGTVFAIDLTQVKAGDNTAGFAVLHYFDYAFTPAQGGGTTLTRDPSDGANPAGRLFLASDGNIYGTTSKGGAQGLGTVFQIKPDAGGHFSVTPPTPTNPSQFPPRNINDGLNYYQFNGTYARIYDFGGGANDGANPQAGLIQLSDGFLYGTTTAGGGKSDGTVYKIGTDGQNFSLLHSFTGGNAFDGTAAGDGKNPECELIQAANGSLYGTTNGGGAGNGGTVFQIKPTGSGSFNASSPFQVLHDFDGIADGVGLNTGVIQASDGNLYGTTTSAGGPDGSGSGSVFGIGAVNGQFSSTASPFKTIYFSPSGPTDPRNVTGGVLQGQNGLLYSESQTGGPPVNGSSSGGTVFSVDAGLPAPLVVTGVAGSGSVNVTTSLPDVTSADTTVVIHGLNFNAGDTVSIDGNNVPVTGRDYSRAGDEQITVTLSSPLSAGTHRAIAADAAPGIRVSSPFPFRVTLLAPHITRVDNGANGAVTTADTKLVIHGDSFVAGDIVFVGSVATGTTLAVALNSNTQLTVTLSQPLPAGDHNMTVTHAPPDNRVSNTYVLAVQAGPPPVVTAVTSAATPGPVTTNDTSVVIHGTGFAAGDSVTIGGTTASVTVAGEDLSVAADELITVTLSHSLAAGQYTVTVAHAAPDGRRSAPFPFTVGAAPPPVITSTAYTVTGGQGVLSVFGTGFVRGADFTITPKSSYITPGRTLDVSLVSSTELTATFSQPLPDGDYTLTLTNPDKQSASYALSRFDPVTGLLMVVRNSTPFSAVAVIPDPVAGTASQRFPSPRVTVFDGTGDLILTKPDPNSLNPSASSQSRSVLPRGARARVSPRVAIGPRPVIDKVRVQTTPGNGDSQVATTFVEIDGKNFDPINAGTVVTVDGSGVYSGQGLVVRDQHKITFFSQVIVDNNHHTISVSNPDGGTSQTAEFAVLNGYVDSNGQFVPRPQTSYNVHFVEPGMAGTGTAIGMTGRSPAGSAAQVVALGSPSLLLHGASLVATGAGNLVATGAGNIVSHDGGSVISNDGGTLKVKDHNGLVGQDGGSVISNDGGTVISNDGGTVISNDGGTLVGNSGGTLHPGDVFQGGAGVAPHAASSGPGYMDVSLFLSRNATGMTLMTIRYALGQPDQILYQAPGVSISSAAGTPVLTAGAAAVVVTPGAFRAEHGHQGQLSQLLTLTNPTGFAVTGPLGVALSGLPAGVSVMGAAGGAVPASRTGLAGGAAMQMRVYFNAPGRAAFTDTAQAVPMP